VADDSFEEANTLLPLSFVRVRAFTRNNVPWLEVRLIQSPYAFADTSERRLAPSPTIERIRGGSSREDGGVTLDVNEVQALYLPPEFIGTYSLAFDFRTTKILGTQDTPRSIQAALNDMFDDGLGERFSVTNPEDQHAYMEFVGVLAASPQDLIGITVRSFFPGRLELDFPLDRNEFAEAMRATAKIEEVPLELELELVDNAEDLTDDEVPGRFVTFKRTVTLVRDQIYEELQTAKRIDWLTPPLPTSHTPFSPSQVITGNQHYIVVIGNGVSSSFVLAHNLETAAAHIAVRENMADGRLIEAGERTIRFPSANAISVTFPYVPTADEFAVVITTAGPRSAFADHDHFITDITDLVDRLGGIEAAIALINDRLPFTDPTSPADGDGATGDTEMKIPDRAEVFPGRLKEALSVESPKAPRTLLALFPAVHDATVVNVTLPLPAASANEGQVFFNNTAGNVLVPGGVVKPNEHLASDGRFWYHVTRSGTSNSFYPTKFMRSLFEAPVSPSLLRVGMKLVAEFDLEIMMLPGSLTRMQYVFVIEYGTAPQQTTPSPVGINLQDIVWNTTTPMLAQRIIVTELRAKYHFGVSVLRSLLNVLSADVLSQSAWTAAASIPSNNEFLLRARLIQPDTENSVTGAKGAIFYSLTNGTILFTNK